MADKQRDLTIIHPGWSQVTCIEEATAAVPVIKEHKETSQPPATKFCKENSSNENNSQNSLCCEQTGKVRA